MLLIVSRYARKILKTMNLRNYEKINAKIYNVLGHIDTFPKSLELKSRWKYDIPNFAFIQNFSPSCIQLWKQLLWKFDLARAGDALCWRNKKFPFFMESFILFSWMRVLILRFWQNKEKLISSRKKKFFFSWAFLSSWQLFGPLRVTGNTLMHTYVSVCVYINIFVNKIMERFTFICRCIVPYMIFHKGFSSGWYTKWKWHYFLF